MDFFLYETYTYNSVDCIVADDNPLLDFISIKNLNLRSKLCFSFFLCLRAGRCLGL